LTAQQKCYEVIITQCHRSVNAHVVDLLTPEGWKAELT